MLTEAWAASSQTRCSTRRRRDRLARRTGGRPYVVVWHSTLGADTSGTDPLADARERGADSVVNLLVERFGLATGEEEEHYGIFVRVRMQWWNRDGGCGYERIVEYGPGSPVAGCPRPCAHLFRVPALDQAASSATSARDPDPDRHLLAEDPALPLGRRDQGAGGSVRRYTTVAPTRPLRRRIHESRHHGKRRGATARRLAAPRCPGRG